MIKRKLGASLATAAVLGSVVALGPVTVASAEPNQVTRMTERANPTVQLVEVEYNAKVKFNYTYYTSDGLALFDKAVRLFTEGYLSTPSDAIGYVFDRVKDDPTRYLGPDNTPTQTLKYTDYYSGSSFTASPNGDIVTARHVVTADAGVRASFAAQGAARATKADAAGWNHLYRTFHLSSAAKRSIKAAVAAYYKRTVKVSVGAPKVSVLLATATADGSQDAQVVPADVAYLSGTSTDEDVAVLHVQRDNMPAMPLARTGAQPGDTIFLDCFPQLPDSSTSAFLTPTVTQGQITAIKQSSGGLRKLQTNATASPGCSGGPAMNENGEVIGILVEGAVSNGVSLGENYLMPLDPIRNGLARAGSNLAGAPGQTTKLYDQGLHDFYNKHYVKALGEFNQVKALYAAHAYVDSFISKSQLAISRGENVPVVKPSPKKSVPWNVIVPAALSAFVLMIGAGLYFVLRRNKEKLGTGTTPTGPTAVTDASSPISPVVTPYAGADPLAELLAGNGSDAATTPGASAAESVAAPTASDEAEGSEDGPDAIPDSEWEPLDYVAGFPDSETRPSS